MSEKKQPPEQEKITQKISYMHAPDYKVHHAHGALIGPSPKLEINLEFYIEEHPTPETWTRDYYPDGRVEELSITRDNKEIDRIKTFTVSLNPGVALSIGRLLVEKTETLISQINEIQKKAVKEAEGESNAE